MVTKCANRPVERTPVISAEESSFSSKHPHLPGSRGKTPKGYPPERVFLVVRWVFPHHDAHRNGYPLIVARTAVFLSRMDRRNEQMPYLARIALPDMAFLQVARATRTVNFGSRRWLRHE